MTDTNIEPDVSAGTRVPERELLDEIVRRIVEVAAPDSIILFGSAARGEWGPNSDIDLLVVKQGVEHRGRLAEEIYVKLIGILAAVDILVVTPRDIEILRDKIGTVINPALTEGKTIYAA